MIISSPFTVFLFLFAYFIALLFVGVFSGDDWNPAPNLPMNISVIALRAFLSPFSFSRLMFHRRFIRFTLDYFAVNDLY